MIAQSMVTTAFELHGFSVKRDLRIERGITLRSRSILGTIGGSLQTIVGGNITAFTGLCEKAREEAFELMVSHAADRGAIAVKLHLDTGMNADIDLPEGTDGEFEWAGTIHALHSGRNHLEVQ